MVEVVFVAALLVAQPAVEKTENDPPHTRPAAWQALFDRAAADYEIYRDREHTQRLRLHPAPI